MTASNTDSLATARTVRFVSKSPMYLLVAYDLSRAGSHRYREMAKALSSLGDSVRVTQSHWLIATTVSPSEIGQAVTELIRPGDKFFLNIFSGYHQYHALSSEVIAWLTRYGFHQDLEALPRAA